ncbi:hypothetical protein [Tropicimonas sp. IMCC34043]|uniref:hypothetical protein n=1 Tax=Tropicimonas sp. IMCC34043 TaxID=2248760 RepID=UPI00130080EE|nr:hypothetical protein [Tropicimonas sp. IMCC34043]
MRIMFGFGSAVLVLLTVAQGAAPDLFGFLPLGGSAISEMGIVLGLSFAAANLWDLLGDRKD